MPPRPECPSDSRSLAGPRRVLLLAVALFLVSFVPRAVSPLATSVCYDETAAKDSGPMWELIKRGDFLSEGWAQYPYLPFYKYLYGLVPQVLLGANPSDPDDLAGARWMGALLGSGIVVMTFLVGLRCVPLGAALLGALLLASFPTVLGHDRIAMHDAPSRLLALVGWWFVLRAFTKGSCRAPFQGANPEERRRESAPYNPSLERGAWNVNRPALAGLLWGAAFFGLGLTFFHRTAAASGLAVAIFLLVRLVWPRNPVNPVNPVKKSGPDQEQSLDRIHRIDMISKMPWGGIFKTLALFGAFSMGTWVLSAWLLWPYMWFRPWELWRWYADPMATAAAGGGMEFWFGQIRVVPRHYYFVVILACTPPLTLLAFAGWHLLAFREWWAKGRATLNWQVSGRHEAVPYPGVAGARSSSVGAGLIPARILPVEDPLPILLLFWIPLLVCSLTLRQALTHYLQILMPALCLGAGAAVWRFRAWLVSKVSNGRRPLGWLVVAAPILAQVYACATVSPYFFEYFNIFTGGGANVTAKRLFAQGIYGEALNPLFEHVKAKGAPGSTVLCRFGAWPGLGQLNRYLGPGFPLQGHQAIDPLGARYVLRAGSERFDMFYRYSPDPRIYEKVFDVLADGGSLGDVWRRREDVAATSLLYADDFASPQFARFAVAAQNMNLNPFSDGKLYAVQSDQPAVVVQRFPASLFVGRRSVRLEADVQMREGLIRLLAGQDPRQLREMARAAGMAGTVRGTDLALAPGKDLFVALEWQSAHRWNGNPKTFWDSDWVDAFRIYGK